MKICSKQKLKTITGPSKVLLVLGKQTGDHREDCYSTKLLLSG